MVKGLLIPADLAEDVSVVELQGYQDYGTAVGGWFETIDVPSLPARIYVNEEGRLRHLPFNGRASVLWWYHATLPRRAMLVGDVAVVGLDALTGDDVDVSQELAQRLTGSEEFALMVRMGGDPILLCRRPGGGVHEVLLPLASGDPRWVLTSARYESYFNAAAWAIALRDQWPAVVETRVLPFREVPAHLRER